MPRILGVDLPGKKRVEYSLRYIYGIGPTRAREIVNEAGIDPMKKMDELTEEEIHTIINIIQNKYKVEGELRSEVTRNIQRLISIGCYRGIRHKLGLPVRGQRTRTNARTRKGPRKTVGAIRDKEQRSMLRKQKSESE